MGRSYSAVVAAVLLLLSVCSMVPSLMMSTQAPSHEDGLETMNKTDDEASRGDVELNMMHFTPSASVEDGVYYVARRGVDVVAYFGESEVWYVVGDTLIGLEFPGSARVVPAGEEPTGSATNYMFGSDQSKWRTGLRDCAVVRYGGIYPGIDLVYKLVDGNLKYEFVVAPYADPSVIRMRYSDVDAIEVLDDSLTLSKEGFTVKDSGLLAFQGGLERDSVECAFCHDGLSTITLSVGQYDNSLELTLDPVVLIYSTFLGGSGGECGYGVAVEDRFAYVTGSTSSSGFPMVNAYDSTYGGSLDCFVTKFTTDGQTLVYSTFLGGTGEDCALGIAAQDGFAYVTGYTTSSGFPAVNAYDPTHNGNQDCFVIKLAANGSSIVYSTFLGGAANDRGQAIAVMTGSVYLTGLTNSPEFPTVNAYDPTRNSTDCFVTKLAADGQSLVYSTFLGGSGSDFANGIAVESDFAYVTGYAGSSDFPTVNAYNSTFNGGGDCFVTKLAANGSFLVYSTFLGGTNYEARAIAAENGFAYVTGYTASDRFPTVNAYDSTYNGGPYDCFVIKLAANGSSIVYSTFLGGSDGDHAHGIAVENGFAYVTGHTTSSDFPTADAYDSTYNEGGDGFVTKFAVDCQFLVYSTFVGGTNYEEATSIAVEKCFVYVTGTTTSSDFPPVNAYDLSFNGGSDCFVMSFCEEGDTDMDGLADWEEALHGTDPFCIDSDNDNFLDGYEVAYGSDPLDPMSYPAMPQAWYDAIYEDLDGNATLIQYLIIWSSGNETLLQTVMQQLDDNATLLEQVISWLDGNHTSIETLFTAVSGNATLLIQTVDAVNANSDQLDLLAALVTHNADALSSLNVTHIGDIAQIRAVLDMLGVTVGDTDYDGLDDLDEIALGTDLQCIDTDCDNLNDAYEMKIGTDPTDDDSDNDTYFDGAEVLAGTDPLDALDYPGHTGTTTVPPMGIELIVIVGAAGFVGLIALLVLMRRRTGARAPS